MKTASLSLGASQQLVVRQLFDLLKTCLRWEARLLEVFFFPLSPVTKFGVLDGSVPSLWGKGKNRDGHHNTVSPRSPIYHRHVFTVSKNLVAHMLTIFLVGCPTIAIGLLTY